MMNHTPRPRPPFLRREFTRHGKAVWYFRREDGPRIRIRAEFGTPEFDAEYQAALTGHAPLPAGNKTAASGSLAWAISLYRQSRAWAALSPATRRQRENIFKHVIEKSGSERFSAIKKSHIVAGCDRRAATPSAASHFLDAMKGLFKWALTAQLCQIDPTEGVKAPKRKSSGFAPWTEDDIAAFQKRWPLGTRERVAHDVLLYTGLRRGDAAIVGRQHVKNDVIRLTTEKTGERVIIQIERELAKTLAAGPCGDLTFIVGAKGKPMTKESFANWFGEAARAASVKKNCHGLRKAGATRDAERGWTEAELDAKYGWRGGRMASLYTRAANRERLSLGASKRTPRNKI